MSACAASDDLIELKPSLVSPGRPDGLPCDQIDDAYLPLDQERVPLPFRRHFDRSRHKGRAGTALTVTKVSVDPLVQRERRTVKGRGDRVDLEIDRWHRRPRARGVAEVRHH